MSTIRRPFAAAAACAALGIALAGCSPEEVDGSAGERTSAAVPSGPDGPSSDGAPSDSGDPSAAGFTPLGAFPVLSLATMSAGEGPATEVSGEVLAEDAAVIAQVEPAEVSCEGTLRAGSAIPVTCTVAALDGVLTAYPVLGGPTGQEDHSLLVDGALDRTQASVVMDPEVSVHYGPTALFFDDPALLEQEGLVERAQGELQSLGVSERVENCEGIVGESSGHSGVRCVGTQNGSRTPFEAQLYPTLSASGDPVVLALIHRPIL